MKTLGGDQIQQVIDWLNEYEQIKDTAIPLRFKEEFQKRLLEERVRNLENEVIKQKIFREHAPSKSRWLF